MHYHIYGIVAIYMFISQDSLEKQSWGELIYPHIYTYSDIYEYIYIYMNIFYTHTYTNTQIYQSSL